MTVFRFALKRSFRNPFNILLLFVLPVGLVFVPVVPGSILPLGFHLYGQVIMFAAFLMVRTTAEDRLTGMLSRIAAAPVSYFRYLGETLLAYALLLVAQNAVVAVLGAVRYGGGLGSPVLQFAAFASFSVTSIAFSLAGCALFASRELAYSSLPLAITLLSLLGGFYAPVEMMPEALQKAAMVTPPYWLISALGVLRRGDPPGRYVLSIAIMLLFAVAFLVVGSRRRME
jgi:linearmycin/streptolysin S transport system permease protein